MDLAGGTGTERRRGGGLLRAGIRSQSAHDLHFAVGRTVPIEINATVVDGPEGPRVVALCRDIRDLIRIETRLSNSAMQLKALSRRLIEVQELERRHLARELHDEIGQVLTAVSINLKALRFGMESGRPAELDDSIGQVDNAIQQVRNLSLDLRPSMLDDLGLEAAVRWLAGRMNQRTGLDIRLECEFAGSRPARRWKRDVSVWCRNL